MLQTLWKLPISPPAPGAPPPKRKKKPRPPPVLEGEGVDPDGVIMICRIFPPANPTPFPLPSKAPTFWGSGQCRGWERVGGGGRLDLLLPLRDSEGGRVITPPSTPLPPVPLFFGAAPREGGLREALGCLDLPRPLPRSLYPKSMSAPGAAWI